MQEVLDYAGMFATEAEQAIIGGVILEPDVLKELSIQGEHFYRPAHAIIFKAMRELDNLNEPVDLVTLVQYMQQQGSIESVGGVSYLSDLAGSVPTTANIKYYERMVLDKWRERQAVKAAAEMQHAVRSGENLDSVLQAQVATLLNLGREDKADDGSIKDALINVFDRLQNPVTGLVGMDYGYSELNRITAGLHAGDFVIVAARPAMGKTAFALNIANNAAGFKGDGDIAAIFSLEMGKEQLVSRFLSFIGNINADRLRDGTLQAGDWDNLAHAMGIVDGKNFHIFDKAGINVNYIWSKVRKLRRDNPEKRILVMIDYLQLIQGSTVHKGNRQQEIAEISRTLKTMARELQVCVVALSQLSRGVESRQDKRPVMSDLRESGQLEQDADIVAFLYRDEYYHADSEQKNITEVILAKHRNGAIGTINLAFIKEWGKFADIERRFENG